MKTLCTLTRAAELRQVLPAYDPVTLLFTPADGKEKRFSFLVFEGGQGVIVEAIPNTMMQPKQWKLSRAELDRALAACERSRMVTIADEHGALVLTAGAQSAILSSLAPLPRPALTIPLIRPLSPRPVIAAPRPPNEAQTQAFKILDAALRLSGASNGVPILERCSDGYQIIISDTTCYKIDTSHPDATMFTLIAGNSRKNTRYPALTALEWDALLEIWKQLGSASLRRNREDHL
ncbi:MAG: hypothetical protein ABI700_08750 [Chloroflexota bacterium]